MPDETAAFAAILVGGVMVYSTFKNKRIIDVLLNRPSTLPASSNLSNPGNYINSNPTNAGGSRAEIVAVALRASMMPSGTYQYGEVRPYPDSLFSGNKPIITDCSGFATLTYKEAGAPDPNGAAYDGQGYTGTLEAHGTPTSSPRPGDLAFWSTPDHVAVYIGGGRIVGFGSNPGPVELTVATESKYHTAFLGYRTYPVGSSTGKQGKTGPAGPAGLTGS